MRLSSGHTLVAAFGQNARSSGLLAHDRQQRSDYAVLISCNKRKRSDVTSCLISNNQNNSFSIPILSDCTRRRTGSLACCGSNDASGFALEQSDVASLSGHPHHRHMATFVVRTRLFFWVLHVVGKAAHQLGLPGQIRRMMMDSHGQCNRQSVLP